MQQETWKDKIRAQASFRGVLFTVVDDSLDGGRRVEQHEYPGRDIPWAEDHGRKARSFTVSGFVLSNRSEDFVDRRQALIKALEAPGAGTLIHPFYEDSVFVVVDEFSVSHSNSARGQASFEITFAEAGAHVEPSVQTDTASKLNDTLGFCGIHAADQFVDQFAVEFYADFVVDTASTRVDAALTAIKKINGRINSNLQPVASLAQSVDAIGESLGELVRAPVTLANTLSGLFSEVYGLVDDVQVAGRSYRQLSDTFKIKTRFGSDTDSQSRQTTNDASLADFMLLSNTIAMVAAVTDKTTAVNIGSNAESPFTSYQQMLALRSELLADIDRARNTADMALFEQLGDLRRDLVLHLKAHGMTLPRLAYRAFNNAVPAMVAAYELYGTAANELVLSDVITRNGVPDPLYIASGVELEYLSA